MSLADEGGANHRLALRVPGWPGFEPGQFVMLSPGARGAAPRSDPLLPRPMAVYRERARGASPSSRSCSSVHGRGTALLADVRAGRRASRSSVRSGAASRPAAGARALLVAGGTGIASVYELAARLRARGAARARCCSARAAPAT